MSAKMIGIDLGTTNSSCALVDGDELVLIPNRRGNRTTPSIIALSDSGEVLVGESARNQLVSHAGRTIRSAKRLMGSDTAIPFGPAFLRPEEVAARILLELKHDAEDWLGEELVEAVITVPAWFSEPQRRATLSAASLAGLRVRRLLNEPTAAALAWAWSLKRRFDPGPGEKRVLVYDLGGGTFDVTVLSLGSRACRVLASAGDGLLGGDDFDAIVYAEVRSRLSETLGEALDDPVIDRQLRDSCEKAKCELSMAEQASISLPFVGQGKIVHASTTITRAEFEVWIRPLVEKSIALVKQCLADAGLTDADIDYLVFSGGSSRIPLVRRLLSELLGREAAGRVNPDEIVAAGAAVFASLDQGAQAGFAIHDALSRSFGVEIDGGKALSVVERNTTIPCARQRVFTTVVDKQDSVEIHVLQGDALLAADNVSLGRFLLSGIRQAPRGEPRIEVGFTIDADEILTVSARDMDTGLEQKITIASSLASPTRLEMLRALSARADALRPWARGDRALERELEETLAAFYTLDDLQGAVFSPEDGGKLEQLRIALQALVAELETRKGQGIDLGLY